MTNKTNTKKTVECATVTSQPRLRKKIVPVKYFVTKVTRHSVFVKNKKVIKNKMS